VKPLLENWGGESTYFWLENEGLKALVAKIGRPRILEVAIPIAKTRHGYSAGRAVIGHLRARSNVGLTGPPASGLLN
jgi:hypothetical protein